MNFVFTGGGTAGHVTPNVALIPLIQQQGYTVHYIGRTEGIERELAEKIPGVIYHGISAGKLRRYNNIKNLSDPFRVLKGYSQARKLMRTLKPVGVFSKGGFVSVPVVLAASAYKIPIVIHESDMTPGLATKLCLPKAKKACTTFESTAKGLGAKGVCTGTPLREELLRGSAEIARKKLGFDAKPVLLIMGGSLGAKAINDNVRAVLDQLLQTFNVIHLCGKGKLDESINKKGYVQLEYVTDELADFMMLADVVISRAGSNSINEFLALQKPMLLIPLPADFSRGDQLVNSKEFVAHGYAKELLEENITAQKLLSDVRELYLQKDKYIENMKASGAHKGAQNVLNVILEAIKKAD